MTVFLSIVMLMTVAPTMAEAQSWAGYGRDAQHSNTGVSASLVPTKIKWQTPVDLDPQYSGSDLLVHYGSVMITRQNTVIVPVKTGANDGFRLDAHRGSDGVLLWSTDSNYSLPPHNWTPPFGCTLTPRDRTVVMPGAGGTVLMRTSPDVAGRKFTRVAFYGTAAYNANPSAYAGIQISTPITSDALGNLYFGYLSNVGGIPSGLARVAANGGPGTFTSAPALSGDNSMAKVVYNCAPALSPDGKTVYVAVNNGNFGNGYLCAADSTTLARTGSVALRDPRANLGNALLPDDGTASPTVGPDGDVYFGVLEADFPSHNDRGWLLHYNGTLTATKTPGSFGWDDTASIVPSSLVPSYKGSSPYLVLSKYNNYAGIGTGDGQNKLAVLDPNTPMPDPVSGNAAMVMTEVITVVGVTPDTDNPGGVREWCINAAAIDPVHKCAVVNSEDGHVYRWSFVTNSLSTGLYLAPPTGEAYTSTVIGPDGSVYATNNASLFSCGVHVSATISPVKPIAPPRIRIQFTPESPVERSSKP